MTSKKQKEQNQSYFSLIVDKRLTEATRVFNFPYRVFNKTVLV